MQWLVACLLCIGMVAGSNLNQYWCSVDDLVNQNVMDTVIQPAVAGCNPCTDVCYDMYKNTNLTCANTKPFGAANCQKHISLNVWWCDFYVSNGDQGKFCDNNVGYKPCSNVVCDPNASPILRCNITTFQDNNNNDCVCNSGWYGNGLTCVNQCDLGWKLVPGVGCMACGFGFWDSDGTGYATSCTSCPAGQGTLTPNQNTYQMFYYKAVCFSPCDNTNQTYPNCLTTKNYFLDFSCYATLPDIRTYVQCPSGSYLVSWLTVLSVWCTQYANTSVWMWSCIKCPKGTYKGSGFDNASSCTPCPDGLIAANTGQSACSVCSVCSGNATQTGVCNATSDYLCTCNSGYTGDGKTCSFVGCSPGYRYVIGSGCIACTICSPQATRTGECLNNSYGTSLDYSCTCNSGWYGNGVTCVNQCYPGQKLVTGVGCMNCGCGFWDPVGTGYTTSCTSCPVGQGTTSPIDYYLQMDLFHAVCFDPCDNTSQTFPTCLTNNGHPLEYYCLGALADIRTYIQCPSGSYLVSWLSVDPNRCSAHTANTSFWSWSCVKCPKGTYKGSGFDNASSCTACPNGQYASTMGATACIQCDPGRYSISAV